jgi:hypothetical protein
MMLTQMMEPCLALQEVKEYIPSEGFLKKAAR